MVIKTGPDWPDRVLVWKTLRIGNEKNGNKPGKPVKTGNRRFTEFFLEKN